MLLNAFWVEKNERINFCFIIYSINKVAAKVKKVLQLFRPHQINNDAFIKPNKATIDISHIAEPGWRKKSSHYVQGAEFGTCF